MRPGGGFAPVAGMSDILDMDALNLSAALKQRQISAVELMQATLARIEQVNPAVNAVVSLRDPDDLLAEARAADNAPRRGWLSGIPMAIKDLSNAAGLPTSKGSPLLAGQVAEKDDVFVARLRAAGALFIGKTNTPEFGLGSHTFNPVHGPTQNAYMRGRSAGGSSGGAAVALATRMLAVADGSDMMGSLRNPAGWNNVYGMRPTWGTVPAEPEGDMFLHQLSTAGPMARNPADMAALLDIITGADPDQPHGVSLGNTLPALDTPCPPYKIGWLGDWGGALPYENGIATLSEDALTQMADLGHDVVPLAAPFSADAMWQSWIDLRSFAVAGGLGPLYADPTNRAQLKQPAQWEVARGLALSGPEIQRASEIRSDWFRTATALFRQVDVLVLPSAQMWPFDVTLDYPRDIAGQGMDTYHRWMQVVVPASLIGLPVVNIPAGFGNSGLPGGLQLIGPRGSDARLLMLAHHWHQATRLPDQHPPQQGKND